jgi:hypothetical protein
MEDKRWLFFLFDSSAACFFDESLEYCRGLVLDDLYVLCSTAAYCDYVV